MAEFKLGRIRFVWKGEWVTGDTYYKDDVVAVGGKVYICVIGHTASPDFFTDFQISPPKWNLVSDGQNYRGTWVPDVRYVLDDIVSYGARLYICTEVHLSTEDLVEATFGIENDIVFDSNGKPTTGSKWNIYAEGLDWKGNWTTGTRYRINDFVKYGATTYVCKALHTSAATTALGLEADASNWDVFNQGLEYKQSWTANGHRYKVNDVVQFGAGLYICVTPHTSTNSFVSDSAYWTKLVDGFEFEGEWSPFRNYQTGDIVVSGGNQYIAVATQSGNDPQTDDGTNWTLFIQGIKFLGEWNEDSSVEYNAGELVTRGGYTYIAKSKHTDVEPDPNPGDPETHPWQLLNTGLRWRGVWLDDQEYVAGDVVRFGDNSYVCVLAHFSEGDDFSTVQTLPEGGGNQNSRPDLDITGTYWNVLSIGAEESVLNTKGDLVYYAGSGPARLPIGIEGQVLEVSPDGVPEWAYRGQTEDVYYVAEHGFDGPAPVHGQSLDKPFRSIRYACEQVERGTKNPNARRLLELNRYFIQREIVEWTDNQVTTGTLPFTIAFEYSQEKCLRDMGYIIDALVWDITHGGNVKTREAALEYVNNASKFYTLGQEAETVASINYGLTVIENVLSQTAPDVNYQVLNGDNSTAVVAQYFEDGLQAENVLAEITSLVGIITDAITAGVDTDIPVRDIRNTLIKVSTGKYYEMLPIIVPAECCIIGDELRSTNVQPRKASNFNLVDIFDSQFSYAATQRLEDIIGDIVQGIAVTPSTGNLETQSREFPFGVASTATGAQQAMRTIRKEIDFRLGTKHERSMPNPAGFDSEFGYARDLILKNLDFIKAEVIAYITNNYVDLKYSKTKCKQDVGYIVDALAYDLTYGGNWQSINAGLAYYAGTSSTSPLQIDSEEKTATLAAYAYLRDILAPISRSIAVSPVEQTAVTQLNGEAGSVAAASLITDNVNDIITIINLGADNAPATVYPDITGASAGLQADHAAIINAGNLTTVKSNVISFISTNFPNLTYEQAKCERDIELIAYAAAYDAVFGSNFASMVAGYAYKRVSSAKVYGDQSEATLAANLYAAGQIKALVSEAAAEAAIDFAYQYANDAIFSETVNEGSNKQTALENNYHAVQQIELNKDFIVAEVHAYIDDYFSGTVTETIGTTEVLTIADTSWMSINMPIKFTDPEDSTNSVENSGLVDNQTYYVRNILSSTTFQISLSPNGPAQNIESNEGDIIVSAVYDYSEATCARDVVAYLDAVKWDLTFPRDFIRNYTDDIQVVMPSNYKSKYAARYYANSVLGCQEEDFYYLRNGTGLRLQTMEGLSGDLTPENEFGTRRVTAGAYASLDPGWGPLDQSAWITARSPYVQNCTTFGYAAVGQKIDGALHAGGNDSMVSNDFTQVISDGIGAWLLNNGRAEMVSVFTYYAHIGYLCESGGRARATNGNNSYGTYGSVAEGVDADEIPVKAIVDNRLQYNAVINNVATDQDNIVALEYSHAGNEYTEALVEIFGAGDNEEAVYDDTDFRDGAVFQVRVTEEGGDSTAATAGGEGYTVAQNTAQSGTTSGVTLAATDGSISTAYIGMKIVLTGGTGAGQYGIIDTYDSGTKEATVVREVETVAPTAITGSSQYLIEYVGTTDWAAIGAPTPNYVGQLFTASGAGTGTGRAVLVEAGWEVFALGRTPVAPNASTTYTIEPNVLFSAPPQNDTSNTFNSSNDWVDTNYFITNAAYLAQTQDSTSGSGTGAQFDIQKQGSKYVVTPTLDGGGPATIQGTGYARLDTITINGSTLGGQNVTNDLILTVTSVGDNGEVVAFDQEGNAQTGVWIALSAGTAANISADGSTWSSMTMPAAGGNGWYALTSGSIDDGSTLVEQKYVVAVADNSVSYVYSQDGINWTAGTMPGGTTRPSIAFGNNVFLKIDEGGNEAIRSADGGQNWASIGTLPSIGYNAITYGAGKFVAVRSGTNDVAYTSDNGGNWATATLPGTNETWVDVTYGANMFIAIASTNNVAAISPDGINWTLSTYPGAANHITFGNGVFVATTTTGDRVVYTQDGINWQTYDLQNSAGTPVLDLISFGNPGKTGQFLTVPGGATTGAYNIFLGARAKGRAGVASSRVFEVRLIEPGANYPSSPASAYYPRCGIVDPGNIYDVTFVVRVGNGALAQPSFTNRGTAYELASAIINALQSNGYADFLQTGDFIAVRRLTRRPVSGSNVIFESLPGQIFKLVNTISFIGEDDGSYTAFLQISPEMPIPDSPADGEDVDIRIRFSQVRLTGHDFLDIGTGGFDTTNYPGIPLIAPDQTKETVDNDGGRVFFTATDQDGNFRVGPVFSVEQSTGVATLNAEAFNIAGLQELSLGEVTLGGNSASISEFSTDPFFTANSDTVVPTQRAIKAYIEAQIGGGGASLNVNSVTAGDIFISSNTITTVEGQVININSRVNFTGGITGLPLAINYMLR
jgi:hypothetical protein